MAGDVHPASLEIRALGPLDLKGPDPEAVRSVLAQPKRAALLAFLAVASPRGFHRRDTLLALFWPELDQEHARHALRNALHFLRRSLGEALLVSRGDEEVALQPGKVWCDVVALEAALETANPQEALELYGGDFLEGFHLSEAIEFERWLDGERTRLRERAVQAAWSLARLEEDGGNAVEAGRWGRRALRISLDDEGSVRQVIDLLDRLGDRAGALRAYEGFARRLAEDHATEPSPETQALVRRVRAREAPLQRRGAQRESAVTERAPVAAHTSAATIRGARAQAARGVRRRAFALSAVIIAGGAVAVGWLLLGAESSRTPAVADAGLGIAVFPFRIVGPDRDLWREGMVHLLSTNLDGVAGLRKIDPRSVLNRWRSEIGEGQEALDPQAVLRVARGLGAEYAVVGSLVGSAGEVRLSADVYDVASGRRRGNVQVEGSPDSVLALVDRLSVEILRAGLGSDLAQIPHPSLSRVTTMSLPALKAYLAGEREYRLNRFREAIPHFRRAAELDSTFALALHRLSLTYGWVELVSTPLTAYYEEQAARSVERLPPREALLVRGGVNVSDGRLAGIEMLEQLTTRYPDYVEGWYQLGDGYYHLGHAGLHPPGKFRQAFHRAIELDPNFGPAYLHLVDDAFFRQDNAGARDLIARHRGVSPASPRSIGHELAYALVWGDSASRERARAGLDTAGSAALVDAAILLWFAGGDFWEEQLRGSRAMMHARHPRSVRYYGWYRAINTYLVRGRVRDATDAAEDALATFGEEPYGVGGLNDLIVAYLAGVADSIAARRAVRVLASDSTPWGRFRRGAVAARENRWIDVNREMAAFQRAAREAAARGDSVGAADARGFAQALGGYAALKRGEREAAIGQLQIVLPVLPGFALENATHALLRYEIGRALLEAGQAREAARYFESVTRLFGALSAPAEFYLGQTYETLGEVERAKLHYARFVRWWQDCDPELRSWWLEAERALVRLAGESAAR